MSPFLDCDLKETGDNKEISKPEYQVCPDRHFNRKVNSSKFVLQ